MKLIYSKNGINIYIITLPPLGVNSYIIQKNNTLIIVDPGKGINIIHKYLELDNYKHKGILITHSHFDHIYGLNELKDFVILISKNDEEGLKDSSRNLSYYTNENIEFDINYDTLYEGYHDFGDLKFLAKYFPGHTPGSMLYDFGDFIFTGDFVFSDSIGRTDLPYSNEALMMKSLEKFKEYIKTKNNETFIFPGHMDFCNLNDLIKNNVFIGG
jgi:glyoxylase-like metal-dependent hydrolase (beta-lactamase superfamily II)